MLDDPDQLTARFERLAPSLIVHTAALTDVDQCEREPEQARVINSDLARNVAQAAARIGAALIHISTDHLFSGTRPLSKEDDPAQPLNAYARTKLLAERWIAEAHPGALVVRTNFFGWGHRHRRSFSDWVLDGLANGEARTMFDDAFFTPILADRLALSAHRLAEQGAAGVFNVVGDERVSKYEFGLRLARRFALPEALIRHGRILQANLTAQRPPDVSLDNTKARAALGADLGTLDEYLDGLRDQQLSGRNPELLRAVTED
jgi:dTDP-4-dehydrorhamnose reductase